MQNKILDMIKLMDELTDVLDKLTQEQKATLDAVRENDLSVLAECMKKKQALSLVLRNIDIKREKLQKELGLENIKLSELESKISDHDIKIKVRSGAEKLSNAYKLYSAAAQSAQSALECNLHIVEKTMKQKGIDPEQTKLNTSNTYGYHADFHA